MVAAIGDGQGPSALVREVASFDSAAHGGQGKLSGYLREKSALHGGERHERRTDPKALGKLQPEPI